jgi:hypothetical protein
MFFMENENQSTLDDDDLKNEVKDEIKISYIERILYGYLKKTFLGGIKVLRTSRYASFFYYILILVFGSILLGIIDGLGYIDLSSSIELLIYIGLLSGVALILGGIIGGLSGNEKITNILTYLLILIAIILPFFSVTYVPNHEVIQWIKLFFLVSYIAISSISIFYIILSFHTSLSYRVLNMGNSPKRLFFQPIIKIGSWIILLMNIYLIFQGAGDTLYLGLFGTILSTILLIDVYILPKFDKNDTFEVKENKSAKMSYKQVLGFYNLFVIYQVSQSYNTGGNISNLIGDLFIAAISTFFIINSLSRKVDEISDLDKEEQRVFKFQDRSQAFMKIKKKLGEKALIFCAMGIALGYHMVIMSSFIDSPLVVIQDLISDEVSLNVLLHRMSLVFCFVLLTYVFLKAPKFRRLSINRYSFRHAVRMFGDLFRSGEDGGPGLVQNIVEDSKQKILNFGDKLKKGFGEFFKISNDEDPNKDT